ncbi:prolyl-tRNA editing enzyme YbaK/EbsC (Cys-tRNA(Pro) deacylase) [Agromyces terreus]|uniref:Prolyl-tRNA editing enzyme YbaK/EbsC (Cys-tRNA(Pro) deacylase) n=1 Tax=Agromyces terreus TaxID=424795 RepID=A0A9X2GYA8_9MICO|nr:YbaK/EbsC family protein [Agromyces terreus]MCP2369380.1 prolyl-tRNA editing enzyme YbaK/EbsC (Cys-tRNA(Pro) deacylase) [Agromyces terreus]
MANTSHPAVDRVVEALELQGLSPEIVWFDDAVTTARLAADALGVEVGQIANSLVFALDGEPILVLTSGAHRVDTGWLGAQLGGVLGRASKDAVKEATGQVIGGVAPVGHPGPLRTLVDVDLDRYDQIWAAAGHAKTVFPTTFAELVRITGGTPHAVVPPSEAGAETPE